MFGIDEKYGNFPIIKAEFKDFIMKEQSTSFNEDAMMSIDILMSKGDNHLSTSEGGWQSLSNLNADEDNRIIIERISHILKDTRLFQFERISCVRMWATVTPKNAKVIPHRHGADCHLSVVYFLQSPEDEQFLQFASGHNFKPKSGDCFIFSNSLAHLSLTNKNKLTRFTYNFDFKVKQ